jgi:hypothetical protein
VFSLGPDLQKAEPLENNFFTKEIIQHILIQKNEEFRNNLPLK